MQVGWFGEWPPPHRGKFRPDCRGWARHPGCQGSGQFLILKPSPWKADPRSRLISSKTPTQKSWLLEPQRAPEPGHRMGPTVTPQKETESWCTFNLVLENDSSLPYFHPCCPSDCPSLPLENSYDFKIQFKGSFL